MKKRGVPVLLFLLAAAAAGYGQASPIDLTALNLDVQTLFTSIGRDVAPSLHQFAVSGNDLVGEARLSAKLGYISILGISLTSFDGIGSALGLPADQWKFSMISIPDMVTGSLGDDQTTNDLYDMLTQRAAALPSFRFGLGFHLPAGLELLTSGFYLPTALVQWGVGLAGSALPIDLEALEAKMDLLTVGGTLRRTLLSDRNGFWRPSLSLGVTYTYSSLSLGVDNFSLDALGVTVGPAETGGMGTLSMAGQLGFRSSVHAVGAALNLSKNILWLFTPYLKAAAYYHYSEYDSTFDVTATVLPEPTIPNPSPDPIVQNLSAPVAIVSQDVSFIFTGGLEIHLPLIVLTVGASVDLERPILNLAGLDFGELSANGIAANIGLRLQL